MPQYLRARVAVRKVALFHCFNLYPLPKMTVGKQTSLISVLKRQNALMEFSTYTETICLYVGAGILEMRKKPRNIN